ncbi:MAG: hypothetical protein IPK26_16975 [Planctomycetes bacterium]|nr:hypothetical protein [Planctomycetota bacterium]
MRSIAALAASLAFLSPILSAQAPAAPAAPTAPAQQPDFAKKEKELVGKVASTLMSFASTAKGAKLETRAKQAFDLIIDHYDKDHAGARAALGFKKTKDGWDAGPLDKRKRWFDKASYENRFRIQDEWYKTAVKLGAMHRQLGLEMKNAGELTRSAFHLDRAVYYNPMDKEAHLALGHKEGHLFFGTEEQVEFSNRLRALETKAIEIARRDYQVEALPQEQMPAELQNLAANVPAFLKKPSFDICGARSEHFTVWTRGTPENAANACKWGERALDFGVHLLGEEQAKRIRFVERASKSFAWYGYLWTAREREEFLKHNENVWKGEGSIERAKDFANNIWQAKEGTAVALVKLTPASIHDSMIGYVLNYGLCIGRNEGIGQGIVHMATWYLQSTSISRWGARPEGTVSDPSLELPEQTNWWLRAIRDQATAREDSEMQLVARERLKRFRNDVRLKSWSFMTWVVAAYPDKWLPFYMSLPDDKFQGPQEIEDLAEKAFGKKLVDLEVEWREWARGDSGVAFSTGYGAPLLPERPNKEEIAVLERLNQVRATGLAYSLPAGAKGLLDGTIAGLPPCELDAEASMACEAHARYLCRYPDQLKWPEAHEENPAFEGFSPRGQRAGMASVIVSLNGIGGVEFAKDSIDGWLGTPYHRFPLLEHNIRRFGYSYLYENNYSVAVLDMGSLEEPYDPNIAPRFILWPPPNMKDVPTSFHGREWPNPLEDQPEAEQDITKTGYPISLQLQQQVAVGLADSTMYLFELKGGGKQPAKNFCGEGDGDYNAWLERCGGKNAKEVAVWLHTPQVPLNKRQDLRDVVFCIPKAPLEQKQAYQVRVRMVLGPNAPTWFIWEFTTGNQKEGLKLGKAGG